MVLSAYALTFKSVNRILQIVTIEMKATEQHFPVVLFTLSMYRVVLAFKGVDELLAVLV